MSSFLNALVNSDDASCGPVNPLSQLAKGLGGQQGEGSQIGRDRFAPIAGPSGSVAGPSGFRTHQLHPQELQQDAAARAFFEHQQHAASIRPQQHASPSPGPVPAWASDFMTHAQGPANAPPPPVMSERAWQKSRMPDTRTALDHHAQQSAPAWAADFSNLHRAQASSPASTVPMYAQQPQHHQQPLHVGFPAVSSSMHMSMPMLQHQQPMLYQHQRFQAQHLHQPARSEQTSGTPRIQELESTHWESAFLQHVEHPDAKSSLIDGQAERSQMQEYPPHESLTARPTSPSQRTHGQDADLLSKTAGELLQNVSRDLETNDKMRNSSFMRLMQKLRDKEVTVQGDQMVEGGEAQQQQQQIDPSLTHGGVHVGDVDVQRELQQEALRAQQPLLAGGGRGEAVFARPQGTAGNPMAGTAGATFASGNWQQRQGAQQPDTQSAQREAQEMDELAAAYEEMNSVLDDDVQGRAQRAFQGDGGRMDASVPGASAAWEEDFDDFDFDNALLRSGPEPPTMAQSLRENAQQQEWWHLQSQWDSLVTDAAGIQLQQPTGATASSSSAALANYPFHSRNPYMLNAQHRHHLPSDTILAREAAVQESPSNPLAWLSLGLKQQENEREELAIRALQRALELDPTLGEAWLALAVSYTNDNVRGKAYDAIERWVESKGEYESVIEHHRERAGGASAREAGQVLNSQRHAYLTGLLVDMARAGGGESGVDADVQIALGVLFNASEEYEKASDCFMAALSVRPNDPHLFNRLGATMANSGKAESALDYYYRALELQPDFARATFNLAIACMNLGAYQEAGEHVLRALSIQQSSTADEDVGDASVLRQMSEEEHAASSNQLWDTLATCCNSLRKPELAEACKGRYLAPFRAEFVF